MSAAPALFVAVLGAAGLCCLCVSAKMAMDVKAMGQLYAYPDDPRLASRPQRQTMR